MIDLDLGAALDDATIEFVSFADMPAWTVEDELRAEVGHPNACLYRAAFGRGWKDAAPACKCGERMRPSRTPHHNSGTTRITFACQHAAPYAHNGHQWAVTTSAEHYLDTGGCCGDLLESLEVVG